MMEVSKDQKAKSIYLPDTDYKEPEIQLARTSKTRCSYNRAILCVSSLQLSLFLHKRLVINLAELRGWAMYPTQLHHTVHEPPEQMIRGTVIAQLIFWDKRNSAHAQHLTKLQQLTTQCKSVLRENCRHLSKTHSAYSAHLLQRHNKLATNKELFFFKQGELRLIEKHVFIPLPKQG